MTDLDELLKKKFRLHIYDSVLKNVLLITGLGILALIYYMYSDLFIRHNVQAFYTRLLPLSIAVPLFVFQLVTRRKYKFVKVLMYHLLLTSAVIMMYGICLVHLHENALAPSVTGTVLVIFIISLEIKTNTRNTAFIYFLPLLAFTLSLIFFYKPSGEEFTVMADIYPIIAAGFAINRVQYNLRYKLFTSGYLLDLEKQKTEKLYKETLLINADLHKKANEVIAHKEEIEEKNEKLQESNATKDKFFAIIAHDLLSPFNIMLGFSELLVESFNENNTDEQKKCAKEIHQKINGTYKLLESLLIWARAQKHTIAFKLVKVNLFLFTEEIIEHLRQSAEIKSIQILNHTDNDVTLNADKNMLATILRNLISNAIKFTPKDGRITVDARLIPVNSNRNLVEISVKDTGLGIAPGIQSKLFDISKSISTNGTENEKGTGLGLILCKEFIEKHGGEIRVETEPGKGSNFIFTLPE
ncbi:MAG TPA: hypothetical protein DCG75_10980 [Bacteroidales bacterium]|nr:hypothetical protein [Bacteroidales bacterium]